MDQESQALHICQCRQQFSAPDGVFSSSQPWQAGDDVHSSSGPGSRVAGIVKLAVFNVCQIGIGDVFPHPPFASLYFHASTESITYNPRDSVWYSRASMSGARVLTTVMGPSPKGSAFLHVKYQVNGVACWCQ